QMETGLLPFRGDDPDMVREAILSRTPEPPRHLRWKLRCRVEEIILKLLEKDRRFRYQFAAEVRTDLQRLKSEIGAEQSGRTPVKSGLSGIWRPAVLASLGCVAVFGALFIAIVQ